MKGLINRLSLGGIPLFNNKSEGFLFEEDSTQATIYEMPVSFYSTLRTFSLLETKKTALFYEDSQRGVLIELSPISQESSSQKVYK